jgi:hypothetical protein
LRPREGVGQARREDVSYFRRPLRRLGGALGLAHRQADAPGRKSKVLSFQAIAKLAKTKAGTYKKGEFTLSFQLPGKDYVISAGNPYMPTGSVTITARARKGTFLGVNALKTKQHITGSWSC